MRMIAIVAAAFLAIASGTASAQTQPAPDPLKQEDVARIEGIAVHGGDNRKVGRVSAVLMHPDSKQVDRLVVSAGGFLGVGGHRIAIPVDKFLWDASKGIFRLPMTTVNLRAMPEWTAERDTATGSSRLPRDRTPPTGAGN